jgi:ABC-type phosphate/phosphonate transport system substrate-binding protein
MKRIFLLSVIFAVLILSGCASSTEKAPPQLVLSISGAGDTLLGMSTKTTQTFRISKREWYLETECDALDSGGSRYLFS